MIALRDRLPRGRRVWAQLAFLAVFWNSIPFMCFAWGETKASSVLAGIWNATTPLLTLLFALVALPMERPTRNRVLGLALGFAGVVVVLGPWRGVGGGELAGQLAFLGAATCYGVGFVFTRRFLTDRHESGLAISAGQMTCATAQLALLTPFAGAPDLTIGFDATASIVALGALGTGIAYVMNFAVVRAAGASVGASVTYLVVVFSTLLGITVLGEAVDWNQPAGAATILLGLALSQAR